MYLPYYVFAIYSTFTELLQDVFLSQLAPDHNYDLVYAFPSITVLKLTCLVCRANPTFDGESRFIDF